MKSFAVNTVDHSAYGECSTNALPIATHSVSVHVPVQHSDQVFTNQRFTELQLQGQHFVRCTFQGCTFDHSVFRKTQFDACHFQDSVFQEPLFVRARLNNTAFVDCHIYSGSFEEAQLSHVTFMGTWLPKTHFFQAQANGLEMKDCTLHNTVLFGLEDACVMDAHSRNSLQTNQPLVSVLVSTQNRSVSVPVLVKTLADVANVIPIRLWMDADEAVQPQLDREVETILEGLNSAPLLTGKAIPQELLHRIRLFPERYPHSVSVLNKVRHLAPWVHAVVLPGGEDIAPALYGQVAHPETEVLEGYHRSVLELALIEKCEQDGIPLMGVCRGFQMISVYSGAQLHQHLGSTQIGVQDLPSAIQRPHQGMFPPPLLSPIRTALFHHQGVPLASELGRLEPVLVRSITDTQSQASWEIIMAVEQKHGSPLLAFQFHPEFYPTVRPFAQSNLNSSRCAEQLKKLEQKLPIRTAAELARSPSLKDMTPNNQALIAQIGTLAGIYKTKKQLLSAVIKKKSVAERGEFPAELVPGLVSFASKEGIKRLDRSKTKLDFHRLSNQFEPQSNNVFCGATSAAIVLNALRAPDPTLPRDGRRLHLDNSQPVPEGKDFTVPRFTQEILVESGPKLREQVFGQPVMINGQKIPGFGYQLDELSEVIRNQGAKTNVTIVDDQLDNHTVKKQLISILQQENHYVIAAYKRDAVGQRGGGHFSPLGAYDSKSDSFLVMDVNPSKEPWVWMPASTLIRGMRTLDAVANRGFISVAL